MRATCVCVCCVYQPGSISSQFCRSDGWISGNQRWSDEMAMVMMMMAMMVLMMVMMIDGMISDTK